MLQVEPYDWSDVVEPTYAELAEIDAAMATHMPSPDAPLDAWTRSYHVRKTVEIVGLPDGSTEWMLDFTSTLLALTDALGEITNNIDADHMHFLACRWRNALAGQSWKRGGIMPKKAMAALREMVELLPVDCVARYLDATPKQVERWLFPHLNLDAVHVGAELFKSGTGLKRSAAQAGVSHTLLLAWLRAMRVPTPVTVTPDGRKVMPPAVRQRILELGTEGHGPRAVLTMVQAEFPEAADMSYDAVSMILSRARKAAA